MKFPYLKTSLVLCLGLSSPVSWAEHPINPPTDINQSYTSLVPGYKCLTSFRRKINEQ